MLGFSRLFSETPDTVAAVDLGSNSFHMIVARISDGHLQVIDRLREMVRLGAGLTEDGQLTPEAQARALECLERFGQRVRSMPEGSVRAAGTNTLRQVRDSSGFLRAAERALGHPIEIIAGREEARLVYLGVAHGLAADEGRRLVVDIGGGSTELIIGEGFEPIRRESLHMGCVSMSRAFFDNGRISKKNMEKARIAARIEIQPLESGYKQLGWKTAVGSSGTIRSIRDVVQAAGWSEQGITLESMYRLRAALIEFGQVNKLRLAGLSEQRQPVFTGGFAVLLGVFESMGIDAMQVSDQALREGLLYDLMGRIRHEDVRERTVRALADRYGIDVAHGERVQETALGFLKQLEEPWDMSVNEFGNMLGWAARLHEIGLAVSHSRFQRHGAYLLEHADLSGFSRQEQCVLATMVLGHRRKLQRKNFESLPGGCEIPALRLCVLLRLSVLLYRSRDKARLPDIRICADGDKISLVFPDQWLADRPLTQAELESEMKFLKAAGFRLELG